MFEIDKTGKCIIKAPKQKYETLKDYRDFLENKVSNYFGEPVKLSMSIIPPVEPSGSNVQHSNSGNSNTDNAGNIESILINEFNAKEVGENEQ